MPSAWRDLQSGTASGGRNYYVPMADLLAGLVFILIIVLQAVALVAREDFARADEVMRETRLIEQRLERLRTIEREMIEPRERTEAALAAVIEAIARDLVAAGLPARVEQDRRRIVVREQPLLVDNAFGPAVPRLGEAIGAALQRWSPCLQPARPASCPGGAPVVASEIRIEARTAASGPASAGAVAAALHAQIAMRHPALALSQGPEGAPLLTFRGVQMAEDAVELAFQIQRAPVPPNTVLIGPR